MQPTKPDRVARPQKDRVSLIVAAAPAAPVRGPVRIRATTPSAAGSTQTPTSLLCTCGPAPIGADPLQAARPKHSSARAGVGVLSVSCLLRDRRP